MRNSPLIRLITALSKAAITPIITALLAITAFMCGSQSANAAPTPNAALSANAQVLLNQQVDLRAAFTNTGDQIGYYPMIELKLPAGLECDNTCRSGISLVDLSGAPITVTAFGPAGGSTTYTNPVTGNRVSVTAGQSVLFLSLPTGSVSPGAPAITYSIPANLTSTATLGVALPVNATAVFALGAQASGVRGACGAAGVDTICAAATTLNVTPAVLILNKSVANLVDGATATGPNYPREFTLDVTVANTETVTDTTVTDSIPNTFVLSALPGSNCKTNPGSLTFNPALGATDTCSFTGSTAGGGLLTVTYASIVGTGSIVKQIQYQGYVQKFAGGVSGSNVIPPNTGAATSTSNTAQATYTFDPGTGATSYTAGPTSVTLHQRSLYTTKSITNITNASLNAPGHTLRHTLIYDVSDYFSFDDLQISDLISDGQTYTANSLSVAVHEGSGPAVTRTESQLLAAAGSPLQPITRNGTTGVWSINLDLSVALAASAPNGYGAADSILTGDQNRDPAAPSGAPTRVVITYETTIDEDFVGPVSGTPEVDGGDVISDTMGADFRVAGTANRQTINGPTASITITPILVFNKEVEFENGTTPSDPLEVSPQETITYKISFTVPTGDVEGLHVQDFVPSPLFSVTDPDANGTASGFTFNPTASDAAPAPGSVHLTTASAPVTIGVSVDAAKNSVSFEFDEESNSSSTTTHIEFLFTITATNAPMADDLLLVNVAYLSQNNSQSAVPINQLSSVAPLLTSEPRIQVRKFASSVVTGTGTISGSGAAANFTGVVPGARLRYTIELENIGSHIAEDVSVNDPLPAPLSYVATTLTLSNCDVSGGTTDTSTSTTIAVSAMEIPVGQTCTIQYDVDLDTNAALGATLTNTATSRYASITGGPLFSPESDSASATTISPSLTKSLVAGTSSDSSTAEGSLRPGERASFDVTVTVPQGTADSFTIRERDTATGSTSTNFFEDFEPGSFIIPSIENNAACGGDFNFVGNTNLCFTLNPNNTAAQTSSTIHEINLGTVRNLSGSNQSFTFRYRATVRSGVVAGAYTNRADAQWTTQNATGSGSTPASVTSLTATANFTVVRPNLTLAKTTTTTPPVLLGQNVSYTLTLTNSGNASAYDVADLIDTLPVGLGTASLTSATLNGTNVTGATGFSFTQSGSQVTITVRNTSGVATITAGGIYIVTLSVPVTTDVNGSTANLVNTVRVNNYSTGPADGGPRETVTNIPPASVTIGVDSNVVSGRVIFAKETAGSGNQNGVSGTTVAIVGTAFSTTTDANGGFSFSGVPDGTYTIRATSSFGDVISEQTIVINNADVHNIIFQARPRIVLTKSASTSGPVPAGSEIDYTLTLRNLGNYPAFQISNIVDTLAKGMGTAKLLTATYQGTSVTSASGFSFSQSDLIIQVSVRNSAGEARINPGDSFVVSYRVPVSALLKPSSITIPNSAEIASYATTATSAASTETYFDVRCGEVRLELSADNPSCTNASLTESIAAIDNRAGQLKRGVSRALALRNQYAAAGYCKAKDNGCYRCNKNKKCFNVCRSPSAKEDKATMARVNDLVEKLNKKTQDDLATSHWTLSCANSMTCSMLDMGQPKESITTAGRGMAEIAHEILDSCCLRTARAAVALKQRRASLKQDAKRELKRMMTLLAEYPSPAIQCE